MGVHISKVKSVDLDAWTDEQVELMVKWGNGKCNSHWEAKLPDGYVPDQLKIENFIRTKYDMKKWAGSSVVPDPMTMSAPASASAPLVSKGSGKDNGIDLLQGNSVSASSSTKSTPALSTNLLDDDFGSFTSASTSSVPSVPSAKPRSQTSSVSDNNRNFTSHNNNPLPNIPIQSGSNLSSPQGTGGSMSNGRPDLKKSILSLYSSPSSSSSSFTPQTFNQPPVQARQTYSTQSVDTSSLSNSLQGLNFNTTTLNSTLPMKPASASGGSSQSSINVQSGNTQPSNQPSWNNEWSDLSSQRNAWTPPQPSSQPKVNTSSLDDDLFKNVWK